jgi:RNA polymerase sigma factor (sigma-70 family)
MATDPDNPCLRFEQSNLVFYQALLMDYGQAWECLYITTFRSFVPYARQRSAISLDDTLDILQESLAEFAIKLRNGKYVFQGKPVAAYVFTVCRNQWVSFLRKNHIQMANAALNTGTDEADWSGVLTDSPPAFDSDGQDDAYSQWDTTAANDDESREAGDVNWKAVSRAFADVGEDCRTMLHCFYVEEKSLGECGSRIGLQENSAKVKRFRCAQRLKALYIQYKTT